MKEEKLRGGLVAGGTLAMLLFSLGPFAYMVVTAFAGRADFLARGVPLRLTLDNFRRVLGEPSLHFAAYLGNSLAVSALAAFFAVAIASLAAYAVTRIAFPGRRLLLFAVLAVSMFPQISLIGYLFRLMTLLGWVNTYAALVLPYIAWVLPLSLWILVSYFSQIPRDLDRAALVDGCTGGQALVRVLLPVAAPGVLSTFLLAFVFAFNEFLFALMLTVDYHARTVPVGIALFEGLHGEIPWGTIMAAAVLTTVPLVALTLLFQRRIVQGLTRGAVKG